MNPILMTTDAVGGVFTYAVDLARELGLRGRDVHLVTLGPRPSATQRRLIQTLERVTVTETDFPLEWQPEPWRGIDAAGAWLSDFAREIKPAFVHFNHLAHGDLDLGHPKLVVVHSDVLSWTRATLRREADSDWDTYRARVRRSLVGADVVVAPTAAALASARADFGPFHDARVIANGSPDGPCVIVAKEPFVLTAGRIWDDAKNVGLLDRAAEMISAPVRAAGPGGERLRAIEALGNLDRAELNQWYARAAIYCAPARYEPFGLAILEAARHGCALVLGDAPSLREVWGDAAWFIDPADASALAKILNKLLRDPDLARTRGELARARAARFTIERTTDGYEAAYASLSAERRSVS